MSGIAEVARLAGVSKSTASRALSGAGYVSAQTRSRVADAASSLGYVPSTAAQSLATGRTQNVGVVMPYVTRWFFAEVLEGIQSALLRRGYDLTLYNGSPGSASRRRAFDEALIRKRFDGLIAVGLEPPGDELDRLLALGKPVVRVVGTDDRALTVGLDDLDAGRRATEHLLALGHRRVVFVGAAGTARRPHVESARLTGYRDAMAEAGLDDEIRHVPSALSMPDGYAAAVDLLSDVRSRPTGIVAVCDEVAVGTIVAARRLGIQVPAALSVIGIDDHEYADMFSLTTLRQVPREQGTQAVDLLMARLDDADAALASISLKPRLIVRSSTAALGRGAIPRPEGS
ncbi:MAG: LacI family DNA-binding transcriptional regulator [Microbacterium sp.]|uniref:LacI family DNA-binding transcriptional regulator n=1 Tax=Microbacterium sp. TaxID=51671 RepID=UPI0039E6FC06